IFAEIDKDRNWSSLIDSSYELLFRASESNLDKSSSAGLPPDWLRISVSNGSIDATNLPNLTTNYSFDAVRVPWRIALDYKWNNENRARDYLNRLQFLVSEYEQNGKLAGGYYHDGTVLHGEENPVMYATAIGLFS